MLALSLLTVLVCGATTSMTFAQSANIDPKIQEVFGNCLSQMTQNDANIIQKYTDLLNNRIEIITAHDSLTVVAAGQKFPHLSTLTINNSCNQNLSHTGGYNSNFNILKYNIDFFKSYEQYFFIDGSDKYLVIKPYNP